MEIIEFTKAEKEVVTLLSDDNSVPKISAIRFRGVKTVGKQIENAKRKTGTHTLQGLVAYALKHGLIMVLLSVLVISSVFQFDPRRRRVPVARSFSVSGARVRMNEI